MNGKLQYIQKFCKKCKTHGIAVTFHKNNTTPHLYTYSLIGNRKICLIHNRNVHVVTSVDI